MCQSIYQEKAIRGDKSAWKNKCAAILHEVQYTVKENSNYSLLSVKLK